MKSGVMAGLSDWRRKVSVVLMMILLIMGEVVGEISLVGIEMEERLELEEERMGGLENEMNFRSVPAEEAQCDPIVMRTRRDVKMRMTRRSVMGR